MSASMNTILIIGGTSGIGEACARRFHSMGKKLVLTGRRQGRLDEIAKSLPGTRTYAFDMTDLPAIPKHVDALSKQFPDIDTVWINGGVQHISKVTDPNSTTDQIYIDEITTNVTAPLLLARHVVPALVAKESPSTFMITSSGLGFVPVGAMFPVYCPTKAAIHSYMVGLRQALKDTKVNVIEIVPPYVGGTELGAEYTHMTSNLTPMPMEDFLKEMFEILERGGSIKEVAPGTAGPRVGGWRNGIGPVLEQWKLGG